MKILCFLFDHAWDIKCDVQDHPWTSTECFFSFKDGEQHDLIGVCKRCGKVMR